MTIERIKIESREQWMKELRPKDITATASPVLLGASEYQTPLHLYYVKTTGEIEEESDEPLITEDEISFSPMGTGLLLEDAAEKALRLLKPDWKIEKNEYYYRDPELRMGATPDFMVVDPKRGLGVVDAKNPQRTYHKWIQEDGSIQPPLNYAIQVIQQAYLTGAEWAAIGAFVVGYRTTFRLIYVPIHQGIIERIKHEVAEFWKRVAEGRPYPPDYARDGELIAQLYPQDNGLEIDLSTDNELPEKVDQLESGRAMMKGGEALEKVAKAFITDKMGNASFARLADGRRISFKTQRNVHQAKPARETTSRPMKILKGR